MNTIWNNRRYVGCIVIFIILVVFFFGPAPNFSDEKKMNCKQCGKILTGEYIEVDGNFFHPKCFICAKCKKVIEGSLQKLNGKYYHPECYIEKLGLFCAKCGKPLEDSWIEEKGKKYHSDCFPLKCDICGKSLTGEYFYDEGGKYHKSCFAEHKAPKCCVCNQPIVQGKYITDCWGNRAHPDHDGKETQTCVYCSRFISDSASNGGYLYSDGRIVCGICKLSSVIDDQKIKLSMSRVLELLAEPPSNIHEIPQDIPIRLVNIPTLKELKGEDATDHGQGLTRSEVKYRGKIRTKTNHQIYILTGMPKLEFEAVLAHELLHVWLVEENIEMSFKETEGFCNLGSALVYKSDNSKLAQI
jgi:hypothetical protein